MAQTLKFGNKTWATKKGSTLAYNDENGNYKPLPFAFTRSTSATRVNKEGLIEVVTNDRPRIDYTDTSDGVLLLENASTNLITYSEDFTDSSWDLLDATIENNSNLVTPQGINGVQELRENSDNDDHLIKSDSTFSLTDCSFSVFAKYKGNNRNIKLSLGTGKYASFNLQDGYVFDVQSATTAEIIKLSNGWYRCIVNGDISSSKLNIILLNDTNEIYQGDGTSGVYVWGAMLEANSSASSYIPTQGSATTRVVETASGAGNSEVFGNNGGVLFWNSKAFDNIGNLALTGSNGTNAERFQLYFDTTTSDRIKSNVVTGNVAIAPMQSQVLDVTAFHKCANSFANNNHALWVDGFKVDTDTSGGVPQGVDRLNFDNGTGTSDFYGSTKEVGYYDAALTDLELETLTSYRTWTSMVNELNLNIIYNG